jgi:hypothetical protein
MIQNKSRCKDIAHINLTGDITTALSRGNCSGLCREKAYRYVHALFREIGRHKLLKFNPNLWRCFRENHNILFWGLLWRDRMSIFAWHQSVIDKPLNAEYEWNASNRWDASEPNVCLQMTFHKTRFHIERLSNRVNPSELLHRFFPRSCCVYVKVINSSSGIMSLSFVFGT